VAEPIVWKVSTGTVVPIYVNMGGPAAAQGPLVIYRIHNDGPDEVATGGTPSQGPVGVPPGSDCDISGSPIFIGLGGPTGSASGTCLLIYPIT
jgi:hypothetical protein